MLISWFIVALTCGICLAGPPTRRKSIESLTPEELLSYRELVQAALDNGSFYAVAGWHGMPLMSNPESNGYCVHGTPAFLLWHRFYVSVMEMVIGCPIPYWDWRKPTIPAAFSDDLYKGRNGTMLLNPLHSVFLPENVRTIDNPGPTTLRTPSMPYPHVQVAEKEDYASFAVDDFKNFTAALEDCHNFAHTTLGGVLAYIDVAAFDPMFWSLHMNTERLFFQWQLVHDNYVYPEDVVEMPIELNSYSIAASDLLTYFDGWMQGTPPDEIRRWKKTLKAAVAKRKGSSKFKVLEDTGLYSLPSESDPIIARIPSKRNSATSPSQAAAHLVIGLSPASEHPMHHTVTNAIEIPIPSAPPATEIPAPVPAPAPLPTPPPSPASVATLPPQVDPPKPIQHVESPFNVGEIGAALTQDHVMITIKQVSSTPEPYTLLTCLNGRIVASTGMIAMGSSPMTAYVMNRNVDISRAYEKLGYQANRTTIEGLSPLLEFRMKHVKTGVETPYIPNGVSIQGKCF